jgi:hypothetical protein
MQRQVKRIEEQRPKEEIKENASLKQDQNTKQANGEGVEHYVGDY